MDKGPEYFQKDARNMMWGVAFVGFIPTFVLLVMMISDGSGIKWDVVTFSFLGYSLVLAALAVFAGILCGQGKATGRLLGIVCSIIVLFNFPIGTIFGVAALVKINKHDFTSALK